MFVNHSPAACAVCSVHFSLQGLAQAIATLATVLVAIRTKNVLLAMVVGIGVVWGLRHFFP